MPEEEQSLKRIFASLAALAVFAAVLTLGGGTARADGTRRYVSPGGTDTSNTCTHEDKPCKTVQYAVTVAVAGDTVSLDNGTYVEQVTIAKSLTLKGDDTDKSIIKAPAVLLPDAQSKSNIVEINGGATVQVQMSKLTVAGPGPGPCGSIQSGIAIIGGASLDIDHAAVRDIRDNPLSGCQNGNGIRAGTQVLSAPPADVGHLNADQVEVTGYQKNGIVVAGAGSTGEIGHNTVKSTPTDQIASNGIEVAGGGVATVDHNTVTGNECNLTTVCGPDFVNQTQSAGILLYGVGSATTASNNDVHSNDIGIYANSGGKIDRNDADGNRFEGLVIDVGYTSAVNHDTADDANYGVVVYEGAGGTFTENSAHGNVKFDLYWDGTDAPNFSNNHCGTASPSKTVWDCDRGDR